MSGKYTKKKKNTVKKRSSARKNKRIGLLLFLSVVILLGLLAAVAWFESHGNESSDDPAVSPTESQENQQPEETLPTQTQAPEATQMPGEQPSEETRAPETIEGLALGSDVYVTGYISYTGAFMEDRTDEVVADVLGIQVTNYGEEYIQTMDITLTDGDTQAQFSLSTLFPGETVVALEKNRMAYSDAPEFRQAETSAVALFDEHPGMAEDKLEIQCLNGVINVTNISDEDITGDILIYYKNYVSGMYYGGITYRIRIAGGLKAGQIHQGTAAHFNPSNSKVVFVTCG